MKIKLAITVCDPNQYRDIQGIHLMAPDTWYLNDALDVADRDGFKTVFLHYEAVGPALYKIPYDVLNRLTELAQSKSIRVSFTHPCATPTMLNRKAAS